MNWLKFFVTVLLIACFSPLRAEELKAKFTFQNEATTFKEGDLTEAVIKVWPIENPDLNEFKKMQGESFLNKLVLLHIQSVELSANNSEVVEVKGLFVFKNKLDHSLSQLSYKGQMISIVPVDLKLEPIKETPKDFFVMSQSLGLKNNLFPIMLGLFLVLLAILVIKRKALSLIIKKYKTNKEEEQKKKFAELFQSACERYDFERVYATRKEWMLLLKEAPQKFSEFFRVMELHQYKRKWGNEELIEVQNCFEIIRGSFK